MTLAYWEILWAHTAWLYRQARNATSQENSPMGHGIRTIPNEGRRTTLGWEGESPLPGSPRQGRAIVQEVKKTPGAKIKVDLEKQTVQSPSGKIYQFEINEFRKTCLLKGMDDIYLTLQHKDKIGAYEKTHPVR